MLEFKEDTHEYYLDGNRIPSVSEVLGFISKELYGTKKTAAMVKAADRGTRIHRACESIDRCGCAECDPEIVQYVSAYVKFLKENDVNWEYIEKPVIGTDNRYAGTLDRYGTINGVETLVDIKSSSTITKANKLLYGAQLYAYANADRTNDNVDLFFEELWMKKEMILHLKSDGSYKLIEIPIDSGKIFMDCLRLYEAIEKTKRKKVSK